MLGSQAHVPGNNVANEPTDIGAAFLDGLAYGTAKELTVTASPLASCQGDSCTVPISNARYPGGIIMSYMFGRDLYANETLSLFQAAGEDLYGRHLLDIADMKGGVCCQEPGETPRFSLSISPE